MRLGVGAVSPGLCLGIDRTSLLAHRGRRPSCRHATLAFFFSLPRCHSLFGGLLYQTLTRVARTVTLGSGPTLVCAGLGKLWVARQGGDDAEMRMRCKVMALQAPALPPATTAANQHQWTLLHDASCGAMAQSGQVVLQHRARYVVPLVSDWPATALVEQRIHFNCLSGRLLCTQPCTATSSEQLGRQTFVPAVQAVPVDMPAPASATCIAWCPHAWLGGHSAAAASSAVQLAIGEEPPNTQLVLVGDDNGLVVLLDCTSGSRKRVGSCSGPVLRM